MKISVRDYRGIERADVELAPVALVAGMNEQGKSCLAEATRAALTGVPIPVPRVAKKDAKLLVRDGADSGHVSVESDRGAASIEWPRCEMKGEGQNPAASDMAAGLQHVFDLDDRARAKVLAGYLETEPTREDLTAALTDAGYAGHAIDEAWGLVTGPLGWDGAYKRAREHTARLKGQWENVTREKYGSKKAETWAPEGLDQATAEAKLNELTEAVAAAKAEHERVVGRRAVDEAHVQALRASAAQVPVFEQECASAEARTSEATERLRELRGKSPAPIPQQPMSCPKCQAPLKVERGELVEVEKPPTKAQITKARKAQEAHEAEVTKAGFYSHQADKALADSRAKLAAARRAAADLAEIDAKQSTGEASTEADVEAARARVQAAQAALERRRAWDRARDLHRQIAQNEQLVAILAPEGLRRRKLAEGLKAFNDRLLHLCKVSGWPTVRFDESLQARYGTRPLWAASKSGQWRARVVVQVAMAMIDGSAALVIDEADMLDFRGRNALFALLNAAKKPALVCMTINRPDLVPDLEAVGMGRSYWVQGGIVEPIVKAQERAA